VIASIAFAVGGYLRFKEDGGTTPTKSADGDTGGAAPF
jgi:hypothetical protein